MIKTRAVPGVSGPAILSRTPRRVSTASALDTFVRPNAASPRQRALNRRLIAPQTTGDGVEGLSLLPTIPDQGHLRVADVSPRSLLHLQHLPLYSWSLAVASIG